jgi:hypothetical protein
MAWRSPGRWGAKAIAAVLPVVAESRTRNATSADNAATGSGACHVPRQANASSIQIGIFRSRTISVPARLQRAQEPVARSITSCTKTSRPDRGCHA